MPQENVEIVRAYFETVNDGDFARAMGYYADDVELVVPAEAFLEAGTVRGKDAVGLWFGNWFRAFQRGYQFDLDEIREVGAAVFVAAHHHGRGKASGAEVHSTIAYLFRVGDGQIANSSCSRTACWPSKPRDCRRKTRKLTPPARRSAALPLRDNRQRRGSP
jgi:ketosteroid isomerase-like protein